MSTRGILVAGGAAIAFVAIVWAVMTSRYTVSEGLIATVVTAIGALIIAVGSFDGGGGGGDGWFGDSDGCGSGCGGGCGGE